MRTYTIELLEVEANHFCRAMDLEPVTIRTIRLWLSKGCLTPAPKAGRFSRYPVMTLLQILGIRIAQTEGGFNFDQASSLVEQMDAQELAMQSLIRMNHVRPTIKRGSK